MPPLSTSVKSIFKRHPREVRDAELIALCEDFVNGQYTIDWKTLICDLCDFSTVEPKSLQLHVDKAIHKPDKSNDSYDTI